MRQLIKDYFRHKEEKKSFKAFCEETKANLEAYYVMSQINRSRFFPLRTWDPVKELVWPEVVHEYIRRLTLYNQILQDYKDYEFWYNEDLDRKNQEHGRILHKKKELVQEQFHGLESVIKAAVAASEQRC